EAAVTSAILIFMANLIRFGTTIGSLKLFMRRKNGMQGLFSFLMQVSLCLILYFSNSRHVVFVSDVGVSRAAETGIGGVNGQSLPTRTLAETAVGNGGYHSDASRAFAVAVVGLVGIDPVPALANGDADTVRRNTRPNGSAPTFIGGGTGDDSSHNT